MSQRTLHLPFRTLSTPSTLTTPQWICRRCLATTTTTPKSTTNEPIPRPQHTPASEAQDYNPNLLSAQRPYKLTKTDFYLKRGLPQRIPPQYLVHSTTDILPEAERTQRDEAKLFHKDKQVVGVVISAGKMDKTVKVRLPDRKWNSKIRKYFNTHKTHLVHDPASSLVLGDIVALHALRVSTRVRYVVARIISPFGKPLSERPPVPTADERLAKYKEERFAKLERRRLRVKAAFGDAAAARELRAQELAVAKEAGEGGKGTGASVGRKGQVLLEGVLPGGRHEAKDMNARARRNVSKAKKDEEKAERNLEEADGVGEVLRREGLEAESEVDGLRQGPNSKREDARGQQ